MIVVGILLAVTVFAVIVVGGWVVDRLEPDDCARPKRHHDSSTTPDLREATVYYTVLGDVTEQTATAAALESAKGLLRSTVGKALGLKHSPTLTFVLDDVQEHVRHIDELLEVARASDAKVHELAVGASYAGDAQPYRVAEEQFEYDDAGLGDRR